MAIIRLNKQFFFSDDPIQFRYGQYANEVLICISRSYFNNWSVTFRAVTSPNYQQDRPFEDIITVIQNKKKHLNTSEDDSPVNSFFVVKKKIQISIIFTFFFMGRKGQSNKSSD